MPSETRRPLPGRATVGFLAAGAALSLTACGPLPLLPPAFSDGGDTASPEPAATGAPVETVEATDTESPEPAGPEDTDVFSIFVGDCVNETVSDTEFSEAPTIDCSEPHDYEVYHSGELQGSGSYPGREQVSEMAGRMCYDEFEDFVGTSYEASALDITPWFPTEDGWNELDDREVLCLVYDPAGQSTGTLGGSAL